MSVPAPSACEDPVVAIFRSPIFNASETFIQRHATSLTRFRPVIVGLEGKGNILPELTDRILLPAGRIERIGFSLFGRAAPIAARLRGFAPKLVHAHFATDGVAALPLAKALGVPLVTTLHGYDVSRSAARMLLSGRWSWTRYALLRRRLLRRGRLFLAVSEALRRRAVADGYPADRTLTHYLGVALAPLEAEPPEPGLILHVGRLVEKKGTAVLFDAVARLDAARLVIIGDGPLRASLERQAQTLGLGERLRFLGALPPAEVAAWMRRAWALAVPSVTARDGDAEGLPTVIKEAAALALPAVGTDHAGIPEAIVENETGFIVPERDAEALAARLGALLASPDLRRAMGTAARRLAERKFDAARQVARLEALYDGILGQIRP